MSANLFADLRRALTRRPDGKITLDDLRDVMAERSFGLLLLITTLMTLVPLPFAGLILGAPLLVVGLQMVLGLRQPWLPRRVLYLEMPQNKLTGALDALDPWWKRLQPCSYPRHRWLVEGPAERVAGLFVVFMWVPVLAPLPLTNLLAAPGLLLLAVALVQRDGLIALLAYAVGLVSTVLLAGLYGSLLWVALLALGQG